MTTVGLPGLALALLAATFVLGATTPRWVGNLPATICMVFFTGCWIVARAHPGGEEPAEGWLLYGVVFGSIFLLVAWLGRLARRAAQSSGAHDRP